MSQSDWLLKLSIGLISAWCFGVGILVQAWYTSSEPPSVDRYCQNHKAADPSIKKGTPTAQGKIKDALPNPVEGDEATKKKEYDLCQQWRMAEAAQETARTTWFQTGIGMFGLAGLFATVIFAAKAASGAIEGAQAARDSVEVTRSASKKQIRAYISLKDATISNFADGDKPIATVILVNSGQSPALKLSASYAIGFGPEPIASNVKLGSTTSRTNVGAGSDQKLTAGRDAELPSGAVEDIRAGRFGLYVAGVIRYYDVFGKRQITTFKLQVGRHLFEQSDITQGPLTVCAKGNRSS